MYLEVIIIKILIASYRWNMDILIKVMQLKAVSDLWSDQDIIYDFKVMTQSSCTIPHKYVIRKNTTNLKVFLKTINQFRSDTILNT